MIMKRFFKQQLFATKLLIVAMSLLPQTLDAQNITITRSYIYERFQVLDRNYQLEYDSKIYGVIMFYRERGMDGVTISLGNQIAYNGIITKQETDNVNGEIVYHYQFYQDFEGVKVPIVLSEIYNPVISNAVPARFFLAVTNRFSNEMVKVNIFEDIKKSK